MLVSSPQQLSLTQVTVMAQEAKYRIAQIYLHWTAGRYGQVYDDYHLNIDADGTIYCTCSSLTEQKSHTWKRNRSSIGIALCCGLGAQANHGYDADLGQFSPTAAQTDKLAQVVAVLAKGLELSLQPSNVMTHCEAALLDGYGPLQRRRRNTLGSVVYARFTRRRSAALRRTGTAGQSLVVLQPP